MSYNYGEKIIYSNEIFPNRMDLLNAVSNNVIKYLNNPHLNRNVVCLDATWGEGKTHFLREYLIPNLEKRKIQGKPLKVIYINAWENQKYRDPILAFLDHSKLGGHSFALGLNLGVASISTEINNSSEVIEYAKLVDEVHKKEQELLSESNVVIIIDELDRCNPEYAMKFIEMIQHSAYMKSVIVAANMKAMNAFISHIYGEEFSSYYDKIFTHKYRIPRLIDEVKTVMQTIKVDRGVLGGGWNLSIDLIILALQNSGYATPRDIIRLLNNEEFLNRFFSEEFLQYQISNQEAYFMRYILTYTILSDPYEIDIKYLAQRFNEALKHPGLNNYNINDFSDTALYHITGELMKLGYVCNIQALNNSYERAHSKFMHLLKQLN